MTAYFITFEGLDGSGKSTHLERAAAWLGGRGVDCLVTQEPGGTGVGRAIREVFLDPQWGALDGRVEAFLVFASRRQHLLEVIDPALARGQHVLCDRFTDSSLAYQGYGRGVTLETLRRIDELATGGRVPDRTLLFDLPPGMARNRGHSAARRGQPNGIDRLDSEELDFYERVREGYLELVRKAPERFRVIRSTGSQEATERLVREALADLLAVAEVG